MKVISGLLRGAAVLIMLFVIVALPLSLTARAIGRVFFSPETVVQLVEENFLDPELAASLVRDAVNERLNDPDIQSDPTSELLLQGVYNLDDEDWVELLRMVAPKELLAESLRQVVDGYYAWLDGPEAVPQMRVDVRPWKHNVSKNTLPVVELALNALPQCDAAQIEVFALALSGVGDVSGIPLCRPPEPIYSTILASAANELPALLENWPDEVDFGAPGDADPQSAGQLEIAKQNFRRLRSFAKTSWLVVLVIFGIGVVMGTRSMSGFFKWTGWPLVLSSLGTLLAGLLIWATAAGLAQSVGSDLSGNTPEGLIAPFQAALTGLFGLVSRPLLFQGILQLVLGVGAIIFGVVVGNLSKDRLDGSTALSDDWGMSGAGSVPGDAEPPISDQDKPKGMFG